MSEKTDDSADFWDSRVGPFLDLAGLHQLTGLDTHEIHARAASGEILEVVTRDQARLYPAFQFGAGGGLLPGLPQVLRYLSPISDDLWDVALWLATPSALFDGLCAADMLQAGDTARVLVAAERDGRILRN
jgi:hypothetical protein